MPHICNERFGSSPIISRSFLEPSLVFVALKLTGGLDERFDRLRWTESVVFVRPDFTELNSSVFLYNKQNDKRRQAILWNCASVATKRDQIVLNDIVSVRVDIKSIDNRVQNKVELFVPAKPSDLVIEIMARPDPASRHFIV